MKITFCEREVFRTVLAFETIPMPSAMSTRTLPVESTVVAMPLRKLSPNIQLSRRPPRAMPALILTPITQKRS